VFAVVIGLFVAYGRWRLVPPRAARCRSALQPAS